MNYASIVNQTSRALVGANINGNITDIYVAAGAGAAAVALYDGPSTASPLLFIDKIASGAAHAITNCKIKFVNGGLYALVDANTEALIVHGEWAKQVGSVNLSGN